MAAQKAEVECFFRQVVVEYNCGDIHDILSRRPEKAGPLLACTVNGIDTVGGMILGFAESSRNRSTEFMQRHLGLTAEEALLMYKLVRCGLAHEGVTKPAVRFYVHEDRVHPGVFLYKDHQNSIWLNVTELAHSYLEAVERIGKDIHTHCAHVPEPKERDKQIYEQIYRNALVLVKRDITEFCAGVATKLHKPPSSASPFLPQWLKHFTMGKTSWRC